MKKIKIIVGVPFFLTTVAQAYIGLIEEASGLREETPQGRCYCELTGESCATDACDPMLLAIADFNEYYGKSENDLRTYLALKGLTSEHKRIIEWCLANPPKPTDLPDPQGTEAATAATPLLVMDEDDPELAAALALSLAENQPGSNVEAVSLSTLRQDEENRKRLNDYVMLFLRLSWEEACKIVEMSNDPIAERALNEALERGYFQSAPQPPMPAVEYPSLPVCYTFKLQDESGKSLYVEGDLHFKSPDKILPPFPLIFHYNGGGDSSKYSHSEIIAILDEETLPLELISFLGDQNLNQIQFFEAWCRPLQDTINYFTHPWAMDRMIENRAVNVASGMLNCSNLEPINGEIGVSGVVTQTMSFHDGIYLSGNCARFKITDPTKLAKGWFVSIYRQKAIVVFWHFIPQGTIDYTLDGLPIITTDEPRIVKCELEPLFLPQK